MPFLAVRLSTIVNRFRPQRRLRLGRARQRRRAYCQGESRRERHGAFIEANIRALAQAAIDGYQQQGRGMLLLDDSDFIDKPRGQLTRYRCVFVAEGSEAFKAMGAQWPGDKEAAWVASYDPESAMLLGITRNDDGISSYRVDFGRVIGGGQM